MPALANMTVKKNDGATDVTYTGISPASGDGSPAVWRNESVGVAANHRPEYRLSSKDGKSGSARIVRSTYVYPQIATNTTTTLTSVVTSAKCTTEWELPKGMSQADINEFAAQLANLHDHALIVSCVQAGVSAT